MVARNLPSSRRCHPPRAFRPCRSSRLRRFSPCETLQVYCALQPTMRFAPFPTCDWNPRCRASPRGAPEPQVIPGSALTPFRAFPSPSAVPRHRSRCPPAVACARLQGLSRSASPLSCTGVAANHDPMLSWACFPFRVLPAPSACGLRSPPLNRTRTRPGPTIAGASRACVDLTQLRQSLILPALPSALVDSDFSRPPLIGDSPVAETFPELSSCTLPHANV